MSSLASAEHPHRLATNGSGHQRPAHPSSEPMNDTDTTDPPNQLPESDHHKQQHCGHTQTVLRSHGLCNVLSSVLTAQGSQACVSTGTPASTRSKRAVRLAARVCGCPLQQRTARALPPAKWVAALGAGPLQQVGALQFCQGEQDAGTSDWGAHASKESNPDNVGLPTHYGRSSGGCGRQPAPLLLHLHLRPHSVTFQL